MARPREFDPDQALDKAMRQFWAQGYHDSSIRDLVAATGVNYYGLYEVFENKHGLFLAALDRYRATVTADFGAALSAAAPTPDGLLGAFEQLFDLFVTEDGPVGCLMCNAATELAPHDDDVAVKVRAHLRQLETHFTGWLDRVEAAGNRASAVDTREAAAYLATTCYALAMLLRAGFDREHVRRQARLAVSCVV